MAPLPAPEPPPRPRFNAVKALVSFVLFLVAQVVGVIPVAVWITVLLLPQLVERAQDQAFVQRSIQTALQERMGALLVSIGVAELLALALILVIWGRPLLADRTPSGLGLHAVPLRTTLAWGSLGFATVGAYVLLATWLVPMSSDTTLGPLANAAMTGGATRAAWAFLALAVAPVAEELLFRGLMFRGLAASWGTVAAAVLVTVLFVLMHLPETAGYWPASVGIFALAVVALLARLRTGALWAPILAHFVHNAVIVGLVYASGA